MVLPSPLLGKVEISEAILERLSDRVRNTLATYAEKQGYAFVMRTKEWSSLVQKIETGRFHKWSEIDDLVACTLIVPNRRHIPLVLAAMRQIFIVVSERSRATTPTAPDQFRFDAMRICARFRSPESTPPSPSEYDISFEIQIRTAFEHAWSVATHDLTYKSDSVEWRRLRLSAQLKASIEQLDQLILSYDQVADEVTPGYWPTIKRMNQIVVFVRDRLDTGQIPNELTPKHLSRLAESLVSLLDTQDPAPQLKTVLKTLDEQIAQLEPNMFPRSISLFQFIVGTLISSGTISPPFGNYVLHITPELEGLFPNLKAIEKRFDYYN